MHVIIRDVRDDEAEALGKLTVAAYAALEGFLTPEDEPRYYAMLANIASLAAKKDVRVLVAVTELNELVGGVVYYGDMAEYGSLGNATQEANASGIRLLAVDERFRGSGAGRALTQACIDLAREKRHSHVVLHTTNAMRNAWGLYERMGFERATDLDFDQNGLEVFGFRLMLS